MVLAAYVNLHGDSVHSESHVSSFRTCIQKRGAGEVCFPQYINYSSDVIRPVFDRSFHKGVGIMTIADARDIIVTTPKKQMGNAAMEAEQAKKHGGYYFRRLSSRPKKIQKGSRVFYVEDGYVRGFGKACRIDTLSEGEHCDASGKVWAPGVYVYMRADSWKWIEPIPMKGFQGFRHAGGIKFNVVGDWMDPKPEIGREK